MLALLRMQRVKMAINFLAIGKFFALFAQSSVTTYYYGYLHNSMPTARVKDATDDVNDDY